MGATTFTTNEFGQTIGLCIGDWTTPSFPSKASIKGKYCTLAPLTVGDTEPLYEALCDDVGDLNWTYLAYGPFRSQPDLAKWMQLQLQSTDPQFYSIIPHQNKRPSGIISYLRISPTSGSIEIGHIHFSNSLQQTREATEAVYLLMKKAFDLGYRRLEWKCDALNKRSRQSALRFGFTYEGTFRNATVYKGRNRDTAWFSIINEEWMQIDAEFQRWLDESNFDKEGQQQTKLNCIKQ